MEKDEFKFEGPVPRGTDFYYGKEAIGTVLKAVQTVITEDNAAQQDATKKIIAIADRQNDEIRSGLGLKKDFTPSPQSAKDISDFLLEAEKTRPHLDLPKSEGYQEYPLTTTPGSCVTRHPRYDFSWTDVGGGGLGGVETRPNTVNGTLGGKAIFGIGGSAHVYAGTGFWFYSGNHMGPMDISAVFNTDGRCGLSAFFSYASTQVRLIAGIYDYSEGRWSDINRTDIYNNWLVLGIAFHEFNYQRNVITARAWVQPNRWYSLCGWTEIWTTMGGIASGGSNIWSYLSSVRVCVD